MISSQPTHTEGGEPGSRPRCPTHGLAVGPDGTCIRCKRIYVPPAPPSSPRTGLWLFLLLILAGGGGVRFYVWKQSAEQEAAATRTAALPEEDEGEEVEVSPEQALPNFDPLATEEPEQARPSQPSNSEAAELRRKRLIEEETRRRRERLETEVRQLEQSGRREQLRIIMYVTEWCPTCRTARAWFQQSGIACDIRDVEKNRGWSREHHALNPRGSIPTIQIGGEVLVGFSAGKIKQAIARATR